jgi:hypothetical protein
VIVVKRTVQVRLMPTRAQAAALADTLRACNAAASWLSERMHTARVSRKFEVQKRFYTELRKRFGLAAQPAIRVIGKAVDAYTTLRANLTAGNYGPPGSDRRRKVERSPIVFRMAAGQPFDARCLSWQLGDAGREGTVSIWTVAGRLRHLRIVGDPGQLALLRSQPIRETDLICRDGVWLLHAVVEGPEVGRVEPVNGFLGVDLGIRGRVRLRKPQRATLHSWAFAQLGRYLAYKAEQAGVVFVQVDPAYTSQECHCCGWIEKKNRRSQASFACGRCGFVGHADHNAACNIARRGVACWGEVMRPDAAPTLAAS